MNHILSRALTLKVVLSVFSTCAVVEAQRAPRGILHNEEAWPVGVDTVATWGVGNDGALVMANLHNKTSGEVRCGVHVPGGLFVLSETDVLVCGRDDLGVGLLEQWHFDAAAGELQLKSSYSSSSMDFSGVVYDKVSQQIYLLDCTAARIAKGSWNGTLPLGGLALSTLVDCTSLPFLEEAPSLVLVPNRNRDSGVLNLVRWRMRRGVAYAEITDGASPVISYHIDDWTAPMVSLNDLTVTEGALSVEVRAPTGSTVEVLDLGSSTVLGSGTISAGGVLNVALGQPLAIGSLYMARVVGGAGETSSACVCRHGFPEVFASGAALDGFYYQSGAKVGELLTIEVGVRGGLQSTVAVYSGILLIGLRIGGSDPLVPYGSNWLLITTAYVPAQGFMTSSGWGMISGEISIPNDPGLVGLVFLTQFAMQDGQNYVLSEVYGSVVEGDPLALANNQAGTRPNPSATARAAQHLNSALLSGQVLDARPRLLQILMRR